MTLNLIIRQRCLVRYAACVLASLAGAAAIAQDAAVPPADQLIDQIAVRSRGRESLVETSREQVLQGGSGADFSSLINLIQNETEGPWLDVQGEGGTLSPFNSGVSVDPRGILIRETEMDRTGRLAAVGSQSRVAALNEDMSRRSELRLVSLTRLEQEIARRLAAGQTAVESMQSLAGLTEVRYVFVYPDTQEIVIGGPAEGWKYDGRGVAVGVESNRPTLQLDDLVTVLRTFSPGGADSFGCSIDPRAENLKAVKEYVEASQQKGALSQQGVRNWARKIGELLGPQDITVYGVSSDSRVARVLVEADYRMKLIGIGKLEGGSRIPDYFELLQSDPSLASGQLDALRWWMTMKYEAVLHSPDQNTYEIRGSAVQCLSENQYLQENGERVYTGKAEPLNRQFASNFTGHYEELAGRDPVFAELHSIFDLALVAAMIHHHGLDQKVRWDRGVFSMNGEYQTRRYAAPKQTESVVNHKVFNGQDVVLQVAGGVRADLASVVTDPSLQQESPRLETVSRDARAESGLPAGRWWWDAK